MEVKEYTVNIFKDIAHGSDPTDLLVAMGKDRWTLSCVYTFGGVKLTDRFVFYRHVVEYMYRGNA